MGLSGLQIVITVILIVVAGGIALFCDYLRHRAQHLRELAVELNVRKEMAAAAAVSAPTASVRVAAAASSAASRNSRIRAQYQADSEPIPEAPAATAVAVADMRPPTSERHSTAAVAPALENAAEIASVRGTARTRRRPVPPADTPLPRLEEINPRQALSAWLDQRAAARPARKCVEEPKPEPAPVAVPLPEPAQPAEAAAEPSNDDIRNILRRALATRSRGTGLPASRSAETGAEATPTTTDEPPTSLPRFDTHDAFLWSAEPQVVLERVEDPPRRFQVITGAAQSAGSLEATLPAGMHDYAVLERAIATGKGFNGLVMSIGVSEIDGRNSQNADVMTSIGFFVKGLLNDGEFACRSAQDEFLMISPALEKSEAQRRLDQIAEQLWDYQLRGVSTWSLLFSWGGVDVYQTRLSEAIAMAAERMTQTRRGRKTVSMELARTRSRAAV